MARTILGRFFNKPPVPYASRAGFSLPWTQTHGMETYMRKMGAVGTLFAIVHRTSNATSQVRWRLYRKATSGMDEDRTEVTGHSAADLWARPNPFMPQQEFVEATQQHIDLTGEGWWLIARNPRSPLPLELWPVRPDRMEPVPDPDKFVDGYLYTTPDGQKIPLEVQDVIFLRMPNPLDPYRGMGPVQTILSELDASVFTSEWNRNFFLNSAQPGGIIKVPERLNEDQFDELRDRWNEQHKGVANAHRVAILENGEWVDRKFTQQDMQFTQLREVSRELIREAFGFPKPMLGATDDVNRANAEAAEVIFARWLLIPRLERIKDALNRRLLPLYGPQAAQSLEFDYDNPVPDDKALEAQLLGARSKAAADFVTAGWHPDDALASVGLPAMRFSAPPSLATPAPPQMRAIDRLYAQDQEETGEETEEDTEEAHDALEDALEQLLQRWEDDVLPAQYEQLERQITNAVNSNDPAGLSQLTVDTGEASQILRRALADMAASAADQVVEEAAEQGVTIQAPPLHESLRNYVPRLYAQIGAELAGVAVATAAALGGALALAAGREALRQYTPGAVGARIARSVTGFLRGLSDRFRRDELGGALHRAQNNARIATLEEAPPAQYVASEIRDKNQCRPCRDIDGRVFESLDEARRLYGTGGYRECLGGQRCRGTIVARWNGG